MAIVKKILFALLGAGLAGLFTWLLLTGPDDTLFLLEIAAFGYLSYRKPLWGLAILLILPLAGEFSRMDFLGRSIVANDLLVPIFDLSALLHLSRVKQPPTLPKVLKPLMAFLVVALFSLLFSLITLPFSDVLQGSLYLIRLILYVALFPITFYLIDRKHYHQLIWWVALSALFVSITGFLQLQFLPDLEVLAKTAGYDPHINRLVGSWLDPNFIGGFFAFISLILISLGLYEKSIRQKIGLFVISAILLTAMFLTYSRSAYLAFLVGILVLGLIKGRKLLLVILLIGTIGLASSDRAQERVGELVTSMTSVLFNTSENPDPTARLRIQNWEQTIYLISQNPILGHGYNTLPYVKLSEGFVSSEEIHSASGSDSSLLTVLATTGILGLLPFLLFYFLLLRDSLQSWLKKPDALLSGLSLGLFSGLLALLVHCNFVNSLFFPQIMIYLFPLLGLFYKVRSPENLKINKPLR
jgi:O-antigen ligase